MSRFSILRQYERERKQAEYLGDMPECMSVAKSSISGSVPGVQSVLNKSLLNDE